jgi:hypothetical protein
LAQAPYFGPHLSETVEVGIFLEEVTLTFLVVVVDFLVVVFLVVFLVVVFLVEDFLVVVFLVEDLVVVFLVVVLLSSSQTPNSL